MASFHVISINEKHIKQINKIYLTVHYNTTSKSLNYTKDIVQYPVQKKILKTTMNITFLYNVIIQYIITTRNATINTFKTIV